MSVPNVLCKIKYFDNDDVLAGNPEKQAKYGKERKFYSSNQKDDYLDYVNSGSQKKIDYVAYSGDNEKCVGAFNGKGLLSQNEMKTLSSSSARQKALYGAVCSHSRRISASSIRIVSTKPILCSRRNFRAFSRTPDLTPTI